jgi:hypothetical protein
MFYFRTKNLIWEYFGLGMEKVGMFYGILEYFTAIGNTLCLFCYIFVIIWYILWPSGIFSPVLV